MYRVGANPDTGAKAGFGAKAGADAIPGAGAKAGADAIPEAGAKAGAGPGTCPATLPAQMIKQSQQVLVHEVRHVLQVVKHSHSVMANVVIRGPFAEQCFDSGQA